MCEGGHGATTLFVADCGDAVVDAPGGEIVANEGEGADDATFADGELGEYDDVCTDMGEGLDENLASCDVCIFCWMNWTDQVVT